jgi:hypothetical protein
VQPVEAVVTAPAGHALDQVEHAPARTSFEVVPYAAREGCVSSGATGGRSLILENRPDGERGAARIFLYF